MWSERMVGDRLLELTETVKRSELFPSYSREASELVATNPYAYALAVSLNRQTKAEIIWTIPLDLQEELGHLDPARIARMSLGELDRVFRRLPHKPRLVNDAARTVKELSAMVVHRFDGDAARIWEGRTAAEVTRTFDEIFGVGEQIANLTVLLLEQRYGIRFPDHAGMDIKADSHTMRVLHRLGVVRDETPGQAIAAAQRLHPEYPGELDAPLWVTGRRWCHRGAPDCWGCPLSDVCRYAGA